MGVVRYGEKGDLFGRGDPTTRKNVSRSINLPPTVYATRGYGEPEYVTRLKIRRDAWLARVGPRAGGIHRFGGKKMMEVDEKNSRSLFDHLARPT